MTSKALLDIIRGRLDDILGTDSQKMFTDAFLYDCITTIQEDIASECRLIRDYQETVCCTIQVVSGVKEYALHESIIEIYMVEYIVTTINELTGDTIIDTRKLTQGRHSDFSYANPVIIPNVPVTVIEEPIVFPDMYCIASDSVSNDIIVLNKIPNRNAVMKLHVSRLPLGSVSETTQLEIPVRYHRMIIDGVLSLAFMRPDVETYSKPKADEYKRYHLENIEKIKRRENMFRHNKLRVVSYG